MANHSRLSGCLDNVRGVVSNCLACQSAMLLKGKVYTWPSTGQAQLDYSWVTLSTSRAFYYFCSREIEIICAPDTSKLVNKITVKGGAGGSKVQCMGKI